MPILLIETFSRHVMMNRARLLPPGLGLLELLSSLDSAFRQVSELLRGLDIPNVHVKIDQDNAGSPEDKIRGKVENIVLNMLMTTNCAYYIVSSARKEVVSIKRLRQGDFILAFDPIDGLENGSYLLPMGSTFGIYRSNQEYENYKDLLFTCGEEALVVAGYIIYGSCTDLVITFSPEKRVYEFTFDAVLGEFILINDDFQIPLYGRVCCIDKANTNEWQYKSLGDFITNTNYYIKHLGSFVSNFHLVMRKGGVIIDPPTETFPNGQFQILTKLNPLAFVCKAAGGKSYGGDLITNLLDICAQNLDETAPCIMGSLHNVNFWDKQEKPIIPRKRRSIKLNEMRESRTMSNLYLSPKE
uniref:fructose-bisphosphatase n=3 Tax=Rhodnius prolixus TaxID=13249 RepID=R4G3V4_RHOPR